MPYPKLVATGPDGTSVQVDVDKDVFTIGRGSGNDLVLHDRWQARRHVEIHRRDDSYYLLDLGCRCAKYVNGVVVRDEAEINDGDVITLGDHQLKFLLSDG